MSIINELDKPRLEEVELDITCLDKYNCYLTNNSEDNSFEGFHDIFEVLDIIKNKILNLEHDDRMNIKISSGLYWERSK